MSEHLPVGITIDTVRNSIKDGRRAHDTRVATYDRCYEVYTAAPPKAVKKQPWESQLRVRYGQQTIDTALVNIVGGPPRAKVKPRRPQDTDTAPKMQTVLDYHVGEDHLAEKWPLFVWQGLVYPLTAAKNHWIYREAEQVRRQFLHNPSNAEYPIPVESPQRIVLRDGPTFEPWDIYDVWWEPMARDVDTAAYVVLRSWPSKDELLAQARTESNPFGVYDLADLTELFKDAPKGVAGERMSAQERMRGGESKRKGRYELVEIWRDDSVIVLGNDRVILRAEPNPYNHGRKPVVIAQTRLDGFEMTGFSDTELLDPLQDALNSLLNMRIDNLHMTVQTGFTYRESGIMDPRSLVVKPRFMWGVTDHDDIRPVDMPRLAPEAYKEDDVLLGRMQLITGVNAYVSGADSSVGVDQNTATGVTALTEIASRLLRFKARMLTYKGLQRSFEQWGELIQQFMDHETAVRIEGPPSQENPTGIDWQSVSPQEIVGNYDFSVEGTEESLSRQQERGEVIGLLNALAPFAQLNLINWQPILEKVATVFGFPPAGLFQPQQPQMGAAPSGQNGQQNGQQLPAGTDMAQLDQAQMTPNVRDAILGGR